MGLAQCRFSSTNRLSQARGTPPGPEGALTALVADGAVQGVVEEQELEHALLGLTGRLGLGEDLLAIGNLDEARWLEARAAET